jgi:hypothetical protein
MARAVNDAFPTLAPWDDRDVRKLTRGDGRRSPLIERYAVRPTDGSNFQHVYTVDDLSLFLNARAQTGSARTGTTIVAPTVIVSDPNAPAPRKRTASVKRAAPAKRGPVARVKPANAPVVADATVAASDAPTDA